MQGKQLRIHKKVLNIFLFDAESEGALTAQGKRRGEFMKLSDVQDLRALTRGGKMGHCVTRRCMTVYASLRCALLRRRCLLNVFPL